MENCSYFLNNKAYFGSYPTQENIDILEEHGVRTFVDLTFSNESKITPYKTKYLYISFPIHDNLIPNDDSLFIKLIHRLCYIILNTSPEHKIYIHCKGGHGRSGIIVSCLVCILMNMNSYEAINYTSKCHNNRKNMRLKWRGIGSPQTKQQKMFVHRICSDLEINDSNPLSCNSPREIIINNHKITSINEVIKHVYKRTEKSVEEIIQIFLNICYVQDDDFKRQLTKTGLKRLELSSDTGHSDIYVRLLSRMRCL